MAGEFPGTCPANPLLLPKSLVGAAQEQYRTGGWPRYIITASALPKMGEAGERPRLVDLGEAS